MKGFNIEYEKLEKEKENLLVTTEKLKYNALEYNSQIQEKDLNEQKLKQEKDEQVTPLI